MYREWLGVVDFVGLDMLLHIASFRRRMVSLILSSRGLSETIRGGGEAVRNMWQRIPAPEQSTEVLLYRLPDTGTEVPELRKGVQTKPPFIRGGLLTFMREAFDVEAMGQKGEHEKVCDLRQGASQRSPEVLLTCVFAHGLTAAGDVCRVW